jgi:hypothetical protein
LGSESSLSHEDRSFYRVEDNHQLTVLSAEALATPEGPVGEAGFESLLLHNIAPIHQHFGFLQVKAGRSRT